MNLHFLGGADEVGASCTLIEIGCHRILVDAGIRQNTKQQLPDLSVLDKVGMPDAVLVTHAHTDHTGALPVLAELPSGVKMYATPATKDIAQVLWEDTAKRAQREEQDGKVPLYRPEAIAATLKRIEDVRWLTPVPICGGALTITWIPAGHILGAAMIHIQGKRESLLMTGDISVADQLTIPGMADVPQWCRRPDVMVMESTYGNRQHDNRTEQEDKLARDVAEVIKTGGKVLIPAFAVGRSQEVILILARAMQRKRIPEFPVYVDGMVGAVNRVYSKFRKNLSFYSNNIRPVPRKANRDDVSRREPCCIVASSGMLIGGRSSGYAEHLAGDPANLIAIVGYQAEGTPGRALLNLKEADDPEKRMLKLNGEKCVQVACKVERYSLSAHADRDELTALVEKVQPRKLFLVHGNPKARHALCQSVKKKSPAVDVELPQNGYSYSVVKRFGIADGRPMKSKRVLYDVYAFVKKMGLKGPFRVRELTEMWFGTEMTTPTKVMVFSWCLQLDWQERFVPDRQHPYLFHPSH